VLLLLLLLPLLVLLLLQLELLELSPLSQKGTTFASVIRSRTVGTHDPPERAERYEPGIDVTVNHS
jgi:hypothetical protein